MRAASLSHLRVLPGSSNDTPVQSNESSLTASVDWGKPLPRLAGAFRVGTCVETMPPYGVQHALEVSGQLARLPPCTAPPLTRLCVRPGGRASPPVPLRPTLSVKSQSRFASGGTQKNKHKYLIVFKINTKLILIFVFDFVNRGV